MYEITHYLTADGHDPFNEGLTGLSDRQARARILVRTSRMAAGNFGDCKPLTNGVSELRIHYGPGYRAYYARAGAQTIMLLIGGDKGSQQTDIETAVACWKDWKRRNNR